MKHEPRCIEFPCTCVSILREKLEEQHAWIVNMGKRECEKDDKIASLEKKIKDGLSCCCSGCTKHNEELTKS